MSPEEDRTRDAVDSEPMHYQLSYSGPLSSVLTCVLIEVPPSIAHALPVCHPAVLLLLIAFFV